MNVAALVVAGMMAMVGSAAEPTVTGGGDQTVRLIPQTMTMSVNLTAIDEKFGGALAGIQQQAADVQKALAGLERPPAEIKTEGPFRGVIEDQSPESMLRRQLIPSGGRSSVPAPIEGTVALSMTVSANWELKAVDPVALLKETNAIEEAIRAALPGPQEQAQGITEEQEEQMVWLAGRTAGSDDPPGTPTFTYSATLPADRADNARAEAYKKAREEAGLLAQAAGMELGGLRRLSGSVTPGTVEDTYYYSGTRQYALETAGEARATRLRELLFVVRVRAEFGLKSP